MLNKSLLILIFAFCSQLIFGQEKEFFTPVNFQYSIDNGTRTDKGVPGTNYWQNKADYSITVDYNPETRFLSGVETISYYNNSQDTLQNLLVHLFPNLYSKNIPSDIEIEMQDLTDGVELQSMTVNEKIVDLLENSKMLEYGYTYIWVNLRTYILPQSENKIEISWSYTLNKDSHMRTGQVDDGSAFVAYFFPRIGVYDDINGWNDYEYLGIAEFYNDFGNYDVKIKVPEKYVVWATGILQNSEHVFSNKYYQRYQDALTSGNLVHIIDSTDLKYNDVTSPNPFNTFHYKSSNVTDFAFALSNHYLWDAIQIKTEDTKNNEVLINTAYNKSSADFYKVIHIAKKSIEYMTDELPGISFPFPRMTVFNGLDEMEYPMMVNDHSLPYINETFSLTAHEIYHSYFPFATGCNERKYAWMDEGLTSYFECRLMNDIVNKDLSIFSLDDYQDVIGYETDLPLFSNSESIRSEVYYNLSYPKAAMFYSVLNAQLGDEQFRHMIRQFYMVWESKHPTGTDFLNYISHFTSDRLNWLIYPWFFEYGYVDLSLEIVKQTGDLLEIAVENKGNLPAPVIFKIKYTNGDEELVEAFKPDVWADGKSIINASVQLHSDVKFIKLVFPIPMDAYPDNNRFDF